MPELPSEFATQMRDMLGSEAEAFLQSYEAPRSYGLRLNRLKLPPGHPMEHTLRQQFGLRPVAWCPDGFTYPENARPGRHLYHAAGLYYIQEPSAMIAAELLDPQPGEAILDLAAAPGGKTTQIAARLKGQGVLVANDIHPARAKILSENIERMGIVNAIVTQATPAQLAARFPERFDRVLLDAPCSGEGMFRKDPEALQEWSREAVEACAARQRDILPHAAAMLKPGGYLVYSTCTFNRLENEETIADFLSRHPGFRLEREERMWPHLGQGEGHYAALLRKVGEPRRMTAESSNGPGPIRPSKGKSSKHRRNPADVAVAQSAFESFAREHLPGFTLPANGQALRFGDSLFWVPAPPSFPVGTEWMEGLRVLRPGLQLGELRPGGRFEPNHALAMAISAEDAHLVADWDADAPEAAAYCRGESLPAPSGCKGWGIAAINGFPLGWVKASDGQFKNHRPKGLRLQ
jgi:NOL1/NOP2/sun family putative RNA methylase